MSEPGKPPERRDSVIGVAGAAAHDVINGLKGQPILLAVLVLNGLILGLLFWALITSAGHRAKEIELLIRTCLERPAAPREPRP